MHDHVVQIWTADVEQNHFYLRWTPEKHDEYGGGDDDGDDDIRYDREKHRCGEPWLSFMRIQEVTASNMKGSKI
jgi:hypothetical protein